MVQFNLSYIVFNNIIIIFEDWCLCVSSGSGTLYEEIVLDCVAAALKVMKIKVMAFLK